MRELICVVCGFNACFSDSSIDTLVLCVKTTPIGCSALVDYAFEIVRINVFVFVGNPLNCYLSFREGYNQTIRFIAVVKS